MSRSPPLWIGCDTFAWFSLLARNQFAVDRDKVGEAAIVSALSVIHAMLGLAQQMIYGRQLARTAVTNPPVFILGHWRTGTTLLHELLACDPRHAAPTTYECLAPRHFLLTRSWMPRLFRWLMPSRRPMDNMAAGWERPQEDEFALCLLGLPSPYERIAFPNRPPDAKDLGLSPRTMRRWKSTFCRLIQALTFAKGGRRLILKSPPHTCRIPTLLSLFPDARFVHLVRDPNIVYPSTLNLWRFLYEIHGLQRPSWKGLQEYILDTFVHMHARLDATKHLIPAGRFHELRFEDLLRDPERQLEAVYQALELGDFDPARRHVQGYLAGVMEYQKNSYHLTEDERQSLTQRWGAIIQRYGY